MPQFKVGDKVIIKSTIGTTSEVCEVVGILEGIFEGVEYHLSDETYRYDYELEAWNPKKDLQGKYGLKFIDSIYPYDKINEHAYYLWLNGSEDTERNWLEAEKYVLTQLK
jgi:hypothetical protein